MKDTNPCIEEGCVEGYGGGAVFIFRAAPSSGFGRLTIDNCTFENNVAPVSSVCV